MVNRGTSNAVQSLLYLGVDQRAMYCVCVHNDSLSIMSNVTQPTNITVHHSFFQGHKCDSHWAKINVGQMRCSPTTAHCRVCTHYSLFFNHVAVLFKAYRKCHDTGGRVPALVTVMYAFFGELGLILSVIQGAINSSRKNTEIRMWQSETLKLTPRDRL